MEIFKLPPNFINKPLIDYSFSKYHLAFNDLRKHIQTFFNFFPLHCTDFEKKCFLREFTSVYFNFLHNILPTFSSDNNELSVYIKHLNSLNDISICKSDKSNSWVLLNKCDYISEGHRQLFNTDYYKIIDKPVNRFLAQRIKSILFTLYKKGFISKTLLEYYLPSSVFKPRFFYLLFKTHKPVSSWHNGIPPGRPIVADINTESDKIAGYIDKFLQPLVHNIPSYIKDTDHLICLLNDIFIPDSAFLFTLDVDSLYTNISHVKGLNSVKKFFNLYPDKKRPSNSILTLLSLCLRYNDFIFNGQYFLQTKGTAMGKKFAPAYANIFMGVFEDSFLSSCSLKPSHYYRYIDDIFGVWNHSLFEFYTFINYFNSFYTDIKVKAYIHNTSVDFLDLTIFKSGNKLLYKTFIKPTNNLTCLPKTSFHPSHTFKGIVKGTIIRLAKRNYFYSDFEIFLSLHLKNWFKHGYTWRFLRNCKYEALNSLNVNKESWALGFHQCSRDSCIYCNYAIFSTHITHEKQFYRITKYINCNSRGVIYFIFCKVCNLFVYIGETGQFLRLRIARHLNDISNNVNSPIGTHFNSLNHSVNNFSFIGVDIIFNLEKRRLRESKYIKDFSPILNCNVKCNYSSYPYLKIPFSAPGKALYYSSFKPLFNKYNIPLRCIFKRGNQNLKQNFQKKF